VARVRFTHLGASRAVRAVRAVSAVGAVALAAPLCSAQVTAPAGSSVADPTRPPLPLAPRSAPPPAAVGGPPRPTPEVVMVVKLQGVSVQPLAADSTALIDGRLLRIGERVGDWTLDAIDLQGVQLRRAQATRRVALPGAPQQATPFAPEAPAPASVAGDPKEAREPKEPPAPPPPADRMAAANKDVP
jgi:hypothetical protein